MRPCFPVYLFPYLPNTLNPTLIPGVSRLTLPSRKAI